MVRLVSVLPEYSPSAELAIGAGAGGELESLSPPQPPTGHSKSQSNYASEVFSAWRSCLSPGLKYVHVLSSAT